LGLQNKLAPVMARRLLTPKRPVASVIGPALSSILGDGLPVRFEFWDESALGPPADEAIGVVRFSSSDALRDIAWAPGELGLARAYVKGSLDFGGDPFALLSTLDDAISTTTGLGSRIFLRAVRAALESGAVGLPLQPPSEEVRVRGGLAHSKRRDSRAVTHHYDVGNEFYEIVLGPSMTYSCARFVDERTTLEEAQAAKHDLVCRKLGLHESPGKRLLDVGCGWGSMLLHAVSHYEVTAVGITLSQRQAEYARKRVAEAGLGDRIEIRLQDYRDLEGESFDAVSSIGMFEHVGKARMASYFSTLHSLLAPRGRLLNHAISRRGGSRIHGRSFINRYVFPDGELVDVAEVVGAMEEAGFEVRDVESLREHYSKTLHGWVANLEASWDAAVALSSEGRARVWRLYMATSANNFDRGNIAIHQVLGVVPSARGDSGMAPTRKAWN
jgi:cyclopropane-fatty-acyl-phospholipid synthase